MKYCETKICDDGFEYEIRRRITYNGEYLYQPCDRLTKEALAGGAVFHCPEELHKFMNLPR